MAITLLLICFISIFLNIGILSRAKIKEVLLKSVLIFSAILVLITEVTSVFKILNYQFILLSWLGISVLNILCFFYQKEKLINFIKILKQYINNIFYRFNKYEKIIFFSVITILVFVFIQGIIYPPNNWDSMTYHMARIPNWISHQSVAHYPTHIYRQIYQPPFSEFVITHFNILNCGDYFSNSVQFFFLVFSLFATLSIVELFGLNRKYKLIAVVMAITIPEVLLQASSTQNDIVVSFFILTSIYFAVKTLKEVRVQNYLFLGLSIGLGVLTKGTAYIYLAPILLIFGIAFLIRLFKTKTYSDLWYPIITIFLFLSINSGHYIRNYNLTNNILGVDKNESKMYSNENMSPKLLVSNIIKNVGLHLGPYPINKLSDKVIYKLHSIADIDINNSGTNFGNERYVGAPNRPNHEDSASNSIHFYMIILSLIIIGIIILKNKAGFSEALLYIIMLFLQAIIFCLYLKWQPWHTRLHLPLFMLSIPLICYAMSLNGRFFKILHKLIPIIILSAFLVIIFNHSRPFLSSRYASRVSITDKRFKKYFANRLNLYEEYNATIDNIGKMNYENIGLVLGGDDWEYPIFSQFYDRGINPIHIDVSTPTKNIPLKQKIIDCIISTTINDSIIDFNGKRYYNLNSKNNTIWLYKKN